MCYTKSTASYTCTFRCSDCYFLKSFIIQGPEIGPFELIVESVEELRKLADQFAPPDPESSPSKSKKQKVCIHVLHTIIVMPNG